MGCTSLLTPLGTTLYYCGPSHHDGPLPAFFYFALAGDESLTLSPYNHPVLPFEKQAMRVCSFTLPSHVAGFD